MKTKLKDKMSEKGIFGQKLDGEWVELIMEAKLLGLKKHEVRDIFKESQEKL